MPSLPSISDLSSLENFASYLVDAGYFADPQVALALLNSFNITVGNVSDLNGDGVDDVPVTAFWIDMTGTRHDVSIVIYGFSGPFDPQTYIPISIDLDGLPVSFDPSTFDYSEFDLSSFIDALQVRGLASAEVEDVNNDGFDDLTVAVAGIDANGAPTAATYVTYGGSNGDCPLFLKGSLAGDVVIGDYAGNDTIAGGAKADILVGLGGNSTLTGDAGSDIFVVLASTDAISDLSGADVLIVAEGSGVNATVSAAFSATLGTSNRGTAMLSTAGFEVNLSAVTNGDAGFTVTNTGNATVLTGSSLSDTLVGASGNDTLVGRAGDDSLTGGAGDDILTGGADNDRLVISSGTDTITDLSGADVLTVSAGATVNATVTVGWTATSETANSGVANLSSAGFSVDVSAVVSGTNGFTMANVGGAASFTGSGLADTLLGGTGHDSLFGGTGNDSMAGGTGDDAYGVDSALDSVTELAESGTDLVQTAMTYTLGANVENLILTGSAAIDGTGNLLANVMTGNSAANTLMGGDGNDTLSGGMGDDTLDGGAGNDALSGGVGADTASYAGAGAGVSVSLALTTAQATGGAGTDTLTTVENLTGSGYGDTLVGGTGANQIDGGGGNDTITGAAGVDTLLGGDGDDLFLLATVADFWPGESVTGGAGTDEVRFTTTTAGTLTLTSLVAVERIVIGTGTSGAADTTATTALNVNAEAMTNAVTITGNAGNNTLTGSIYADTLNGGSGNDILIGGSGNDNLTGGAGNDIFTVAVGSDTITDLGGGDMFSVAAGATLAATVTAAWTATSATSNAGTAALTSNGVAMSLAAVTGGSFGFSLTNTGGSATLTGSKFADTLTGGTGADTLTGGAGADSLMGAEGNDVFVVALATDLVTGEVIAGLSGTDELRFTATSASTLTLTSGVAVERVVIGTGTAAAAVSTGTTALNVNGALAANGLILLGNAGANVLTGSAFNDSLEGGAGNDSLIGGNGADTLVGGLGTDVLTGGAGADVFVFNSTLSSTANKDTVIDFNGANDDIWLAKSVMAGLGNVTGALGADAFWGGLGITASHDNTDRIVYNQSTGVLSYDADGTGATAAVQIAQLSANTVLTVSDFVII